MKRFICATLIVSMLTFSYSLPAQATMIATGESVAGAPVQSDRDKLRNLAARADVLKELAAFGIDAAAAKNRVDALTDEEVQQLAGNVDALPAGGLIIEVLLIILLVFAIVRVAGK